MKFSYCYPKPHRGGIRTFLVIFSAMFLIFSAGSVRGSSGESHNEANRPAGWTATDTYRAMNFIVLAVGLFVLLRKPVSQALGGRIKNVQRQLGELEAQKKAVEKKLAEYDRRLSSLEQEAEKIVDEYIKQGNEAKSKILQEAQSAAEKVKAQAKKSIEHEFKEAALRLQEEILEKAVAKAEGMIKEKISIEDQDRLIDEYLKKVMVS